jgi:benzoyl-CoA reductase/2-hydroxyglutaryl-CoA dehydratase subunit BcrC/BadD/HgdB
MRKSDKKIENKLREQLTKVCDKALAEIEGFEWLTHDVNYANFPDSLRIICIFNCREDIEKMAKSGLDRVLYSLIKGELEAVKIDLKKVSAHTVFDSEEMCDLEHEGQWAERIKQRHLGQRKLH